ncbi:MAG: cytochrome P450 [Acidimicrobiales bacterium]
MTDQPTDLVYDPYAYAIHEDPYPTYARLRAEAPLYHNAERGFYALSRHADVSTGFRDSARFSNTFGVSLEKSASGPNAARTQSFLGMDPPEHTRMRALVSRGFTPRRVAQMEDQIRRITLEHLEPALERGEFDFVTDLAGKLPMDVVSELMGVPKADRTELRRNADLLLHREDGVYDVPPAGIEAAFTLAAYYMDLIADRRRQRRDDLTSALLDVELDGDRLDDGEVMAFLNLMVVAGNETTTKLLANAWHWAWRYPDQRAKPFDDHDRVDDWVEETLRFDTSSQMLARMTMADVEMEHGTIPAGERVLLLAGSANRDESVFPDGDRYDLDRDTSGLLSFGVGRHFCLGASLARLEARVCLRELVSRVSDYEIDPDGAVRVHSVNVRGFANLPTTVVTR